AAISVDTAPAPTPHVAAEAMRRRSESVHRFLPPERDSAADAAEGFTSDEEPIPHSTSHQPRPQSPQGDSAHTWQSSQPRSRDDRESPRSWETDRPDPQADEESRPAPIGSKEEQPEASPAAATYGRRPRRNAGRR